MCANRSEMNEEDLGIRAYQVRRAKAVERAVQLTRHGLADQWETLTEDEIEELEWVFGELWSYVSHQKWDGLPFGHLTIRDIIKILTLGSQLRRHTRPGVELLRDIDGVIEQYA